jgi:ABC-type lipoprotein release transport system permease subunit
MITLVALSTWAIIIFWGITEGFMKTMIDAQTRLDTGDLQIHRVGYLDDPDLQRALGVNDLQTIQAELEKDSDLRASSARLKLEALLKSAYGTTGVEVRGLELPAETHVTDLAKAIVAGRFLQNPGEIVLGRALATDLDIRLGERVVLEAQGVKKTTARAFQLVGILATGLTLFDRSTAFVSLGDAQVLTSLDGATEIAIALQTNTTPSRVAGTLRKALPTDYTVSTFLELNPLLADYIKIENIEMIPWMLILAILAGFGVANTVMFTVMERTREFGVLMALGLKPRRVARLVLLESLFASGLGFLLGAAAGYGVNEYLARFGMDFGFYAETFPDLGMPHILYATNSGWYWLYGLSVVVLTALVAAWYPARRAAALEPTEAIRHI